MKGQLTLSILALISLIHPATGQTAFAELSYNNVRARFNSGGDYFYQPDSLKGTYEFPKGTGHQSNFAAALWVGGYDAGSGVLKVAAQTYRQSGTDYWCGPLDNTGVIDSTTASNWDYVWQVSATEISTHQAQANRTIGNTPSDIVTWPAKGNAYAAGKGGAALSVTADLAPFVDVNLDGLYNFIDGDYPLIKGGQALWWVYNDAKPHTETNSLPLQLQIAAMAYACNADVEEGNTVRLDLDIKNFGGTLSNTVYTMWTDADLGYGQDDYMGADSALRTAIIYNGAASDPIYGTALTQHGMMLLHSSTDTPTNAIGAISTFYNNPGIAGNPTTRQDYYNFMNGRWKNGASMTKTCNLLSAGAFTTIVYGDDPSVAAGHSMVACSAPPADARALVSTTPTQLASGQSVQLSYAFFNTPVGTANSNFSAIRTMAQSLKNKYASNACGVGFPTSVHQQLAPGKLQILPNPASNIATVVGIRSNTYLTAYRADGALYFHQLQHTSTGELDCAQWPRGLYLIRNGSSTTTLMVQ
jgi:hypothetical protein